MTESKERGGGGAEKLTFAQSLDVRQNFSKLKCHKQVLIIQFDQIAENSLWVTFIYQRALVISVAIKSKK